MTQDADAQDPHGLWLRALNDKVRGPRGLRPSVPTHVLERIAALIGDEAPIDWVESTVRYAKNDEGEGLVGALAVFGQRLLAVATLQNVQERQWAGFHNDEGTVDVRLIRRSDLTRMEVPVARGYDNRDEAWSSEVSGTWRYRTSIDLTYRDGTKFGLGGGDSGDLLLLLPALREDLLA
ncbi:hypothetical protein [Knoellia aerolata]|uniref:Uncharacterized protein n=1 Tax=Knoellia aerolata DSM 18566 TaxID=1385519 RepID=A0A0A0JYA9_9MICO|nr:hypothetical protein [Knoellia aerolata]KGN41047.1 hypothetical protein N801_09720 [Knoellia aerolata DSM 18566]